MKTICAISTPYGSGGIAVIRVSGPCAVEIVSSLTKPLGKEKGYSMHYCHVQRNGEILDDVLVSVFRAPHSFTGEDVVEIACHGSLYIQQTIIQWLTDAGCNAAKPGEFTQRAFLNGKMDLSQAEAVADLIAAETKSEKDLALSQLRGGISTELKQLRERLLTFTSLVELELDFADHEELEFADRKQLNELANGIENHISKLTSSFRTGNAIKNGIPVAIVGASNAGKSTLLNALVGEERAIVSNIMGTTRDTIEETMILNGIQFRFIDTAGIRETQDQIEALGIERSRQAIEKAQIIIHVIDASQPVKMELPKGKNILEVYNKADLKQEPGKLCISAKKGELGDLKQQLIHIAGIQESKGIIISNARHYEALVRALEAIRRVKKGLADNISGEWLSMDLQDCLNALGEITGEITSQDILNNIFSKFCIGK